MKTLLEMREKLKIFLSKYDIYIYPVLKFIMALVTFLLINGHVGFMKKLDNPGIALVLALLLQISIFSLDYSRTEYVQFEDDEYYYYVKAVPKISIAVPQKKVKKINAQKAPQRKVSSGRKKSSASRHQ